MADALSDQVKNRLAQKMSPHRIRAELIESGYAEQEIEEALHAQAPAHLKVRDATDRRNSRILAWRELLDRFGYGAAAPPFLNILFYQAGAGIFLLGLVNGVKAALSMGITSTLQEYGKVHRMPKRLIGGAGILFGFSFLFMAFAIRAKLVWPYAVGLLLASVGVVVYGDLYTTFVLETIKREKMGTVLRRMGQYGVLITMAAMLLGGWLIDTFPETGSLTFVLFGMTFQPIGYLLAFEITALSFIISGYLFHQLTEGREERRYPLRAFLRSHTRALCGNLKETMRHKYLSLLLVAAIIAGLLEVLGQSYYGLFIYEQFRHLGFGGFLNVAILYGIAILTSFTGPWFTHLLRRSIGLAPMLVFGTLLMAILPFTLFRNANIVAVALALALSVIGGAIVGMAQGLLARKLMGEEARKRYFMSIGFAIAPAYLLLIPLGAWLASVIGLRTLFLGLGIGFAAVVMPLYFLLVTLANKERL